MKTSNILIILAGLILIAGYAAYQAGMLPANLTNGGAANTPATASATATATQAGAPAQDAPDTTVTLPEQTIKHLLATLNPEQKKALLDDTAAFKKLIEQETMNLALVRAARASQLNSDPLTQFLVQRGADKALSEIYLTSFINSKIPRDFPSEEQIQQYFEQNKANLKVGERLAVWQIFLPVPQGADEAAAAAVASEAERLAAGLKSGELNYETTALQYSKHETSRLNGGYMGIVKSSELLPEIRDIVAGMKSGEVSPAIKSTMGYHILKKGDVFPEQDLELDQIRNEVRNVMINQARAQLRDAIGKEVIKTFPVTVDEATVEKWRQDLLTGK